MTQHVLYDHQTFGMQPFGGISRYFCELAARIDRIDDFRARIVAPLHRNHHLAGSAAPRLAWRCDAAWRLAPRLSNQIDKVVVEAFVRAAHPQVVHRTYYWRAPKPRNALSVLTVFDMIHERFPQYFAAGDPTTRLKRRAVEAADLVLCISRSTAADLMSLFDVPAHKVSVVHLGFSDAFADVAGGARLPGWSRTRPYLLYVGPRAGYKNFAAVLQAYRQSAALQDAFDLVAFGSSPFDADEQAATAAPLRPGLVQHRTGGDAELADSYRCARAFVYPSLYEGFGIPPLEAMASGCPVACSNVSSIPEVVGDAGEYFDPNEPESVRAALERVCFDETRRRQLIAAGRQRVRQFSWNRCAQQTAAAYAEALGHAR